MQLDFLHNSGRYDDRGNELYSEYDLVYGIQYASDYLGAGVNNEPLEGFCLKSFQKWCNSQLTHHRSEGK